MLRVLPMYASVFAVYSEHDQNVRLYAYKHIYVTAWLLRIIYIRHNGMGPFIQRLKYYNQIGVF